MCVCMSKCLCGGVCVCESERERVKRYLIHLFNFFFLDCLLSEDNFSMRCPKHKVVVFDMYTQRSVVC